MQSLQRLNALFWVLIAISLPSVLSGQAGTPKQQVPQKKTARQATSAYANLVAEEASMPLGGPGKFQSIDELKAFLHGRAEYARKLDAALAAGSISQKQHDELTLRNRRHSLGQRSQSKSATPRGNSTPDAERTTQLRTLMDVVSDPRYSKERFMRALLPAAALKKELLARRLVTQLNRVYGWNLSEEGNWTTQQVNNLMYDIVLAPGYEQEKFLAAIAANRRPQS